LSRGVSEVLVALWFYIHLATAHLDYLAGMCYPITNNRSFSYNNRIFLINSL
jgi:hypothetical protein